jgi:hypothetical protein
MRRRRFMGTSMLQLQGGPLLGSKRKATRAQPQAAKTEIQDENDHGILEHSVQAF